MVYVFSNRPSIAEKIILNYYSIAIFKAKIRSILKLIKTLFSTSINPSNSNVSESVLCISKSTCVSTKKVVDLAVKPPNNTINIEEEMGPVDIGYARVSSREQAEDTNALNQQIARLKDAGATLILHDVEKGKKDSRVQFQEMKRLVKTGKVRTLIVTKLDRVTRSLSTLKKLIQVLQEYNVNLVVIDQNIDLSSPQGKLMVNILGTLAEWEVDLLSDRVKKGMDYIRKQGWANGSCPFGYVVMDHKYVLDQIPFLCLLSDRPDNYLDFYGDRFVEVDLYKLPCRTVSEVARDCVEIYLYKRGVRPALKAIFEKYGVQKTQAKCNGTDRVLHWTIRGFSLWVRNPVLEGHTCYGKEEQRTDGKKRIKPREEWTYLYDTHSDQRLVQEGEAEEIKRIFEGNQNSGGGTFKAEGGHRPYGYQIGLVYCAACGSRGIKKRVYSPSREYGYYGCRHAGLGCSNHKNVKQTDIEQALIEAIVQEAKVLNQGKETRQPVAPFKTERLKKLEEQLGFLEQFPGFNPVAQACRGDIQRQIQEEQNFYQWQELEERTVEEIIQLGSSMSVWHTLSGKEKSQIYRRIVHRIFLRNGRVESVIFKGNSALTLLQEAADA